MRLGALAVILILATPPQRQTLNVYPPGLVVGHGVRVTCRVPRHEANRQVTWGFEDWTTSTRQLDGDAAPITWQMLLNHVPCEPGPAFCIVARADGSRAIRVTQNVVVLGCD